MKKYLILIFLVASLFVNNLVSAEEVSSECFNFTKNIAYRSSGSDVKNLQIFLKQKGYLNTEATGFFGILTQKALKDFQSKNSLGNSGTFGPNTRALIKNMSCGNFSSLNKNIDLSQTKSSCKANSSPSITLISPNGGEKYKPGQQIEVKWKSCNFSKKDKNVQIYLSSKGSGDKLLLNTPNDGTEIITLPPEDDFTKIEGYKSKPASGNFHKIYITTNRVGFECQNIEPCNVIETYDHSDNTFAIGDDVVFLKPDPNISLKLLSPNGGEVYSPGEKIEVKWESKNVPENTKIYLHIISINPGGRSDQTLSQLPDYSPTINDGKEFVYIPQLGHGFYGKNDPFGTKYKISLTSDTISTCDSTLICYKTDPTDLSDNFFTIQKADGPIIGDGCGGGGLYSSTTGLACFP